MSRHVWWTAAARRSIEALSAENRERFDAISAFLAVSPFRMAGTRVIQPTTFYGRSLFKYFNNDFPYIIFYRIEVGEERGDIVIELVLRGRNDSRITTP